MHPVRNHGGGRIKEYCSHTCYSRIWARANKVRSDEIKRKSAAKPECKAKKQEYARKHRRWLLLTPEYKLWNGAKTRAREKQLSFTIQPQDIKIPKICPLLNIPLVSGSHSNASPSLDRIECDKGYVPDNIWVISHKANTAKSNLSLSELKLLADNLEAALIHKRITNVPK